MTFKIQRRLPKGNSSDFSIIRIHYPFPNSIRVQAGGKTIHPISIQEINQEKIDPTVCGSNIFFYENYTILFAVNGDLNCKVRVSMTNSIKLTVRFDINIDDFFANDGKTLFIDRMCAMLKINDTSRLKVVGVYSGSVIVNSYLDDEAVPIEDSKSANQTSSAESIATLQATIDKAIVSGELESALTSSPGLGTVQEVSASTVLIQTEELESNEENNGSLIIGIVLGVIIIVCLTIIGGVCYMRKRAKIIQLEGDDLPSESDSQKDNHKSKINTEDNFSIINIVQQRKEMY